ncbi:hypothetical protein [Mesorhizobium amorphae]|uniref:hypothetical protein n=1 Tax=Mesorhizobium amorphae TaxID=71433 RepID=UPI0011823CCF|nr:hypothetical protein [Mesorhizobium amorphae]
MIVDLPAIRFAPTRPELVDSVSVSRAGNRVISVVDYADPFWQIAMRTLTMSAQELQMLLAFRDRVRSGMVTVIHRPTDNCLPQAYWGNPGAIQLNNGTLQSVTGGFNVTLNNLINGLKMMPGDLFSLKSGNYRSLHRVMVGGTAAANALSLTVEPFVPPYIAPGAVARFLKPELNTRVVPGSFSVSEDHFPVATFTLVEVPR